VTDTLTEQQRSACMRAVRGKDTTPELVVRRLVHSMGFRYALHSKNLPGKPDLVFTSRKRIIFVHGCFWHKHNCPHGRVSPAANSDYWRAKREKNAIRDRQHTIELRKRGWKVLVLWECWTKDLNSLTARLEAFLIPTRILAST
jgi:DNA mismatch endonuclease (patch repair protein)